MSVDSEAVVSDAELITAVRAGDVTSFADLYERHEAAALTVARQYSNSQQDAEDATSEAFSRVLATIQGGGGPDVAFRAYLFTVVRRVALARVEAARRVAPTADDAAFDAIVEPVESTEAPTMAGLERGLVARAYRSLPERWQAVLWYTEVEGMSPAQVAPALGLTANGVAALSYRAREGLRQAYLQQHLAEPRSEACTIVNAKLGAYVRGGLAKRETALVESHLEECGACRAVVLELGDVNHGMRAVIGPLVLGAAALAALAGVGLGGSAATGVAAGVAAGGAGSTTTGTGTAGSGAAGSAGAGSVTAGSAATGSAVGVGSSVASVGTAAASGVAAIGAGSAVASTSAMAVAATGGLAGLVAALPVGLVATAVVAVMGLSALAVGGALGLFSPEEPTSVVRAEDATAPVADPGSASPEASLSPEPSPSPAPSPEPIPTLDPTSVPTDPTADPTAEPGPGPSTGPTSGPTTDPTRDPTSDPTADPTSDPTVDPTSDPTVDPTVDPTPDPTVDPTPDPTVDPTPDPTVDPTPDPTVDPTDDPTDPPLPPGVVLAGFSPEGLAFAAGTPSRIAVEVSNTGGTASQEVKLELVVGPGVTAIVTPVVPAGAPAPGVAAQLAAPWTCDGPVCTLPSLAPSETSTLTLDVTLDAPGVDGTADIEVGLRAWLPEAGAAPAPQTHPVPFTSAPAVLQVVADAEQVFPLRKAAPFRFTAANTGGTTAHGVGAEIILPQGVTWDGTGDCTLAGSTLSCRLGDLGPRSEKQFAVPLQVDPLSTEIGVTLVSADAPTATTRASVTTPQAVLQIVDGAGAAGEVGDESTGGVYTYVVTNAGTAATQGLRFTADLPWWVIRASGAIQGWSCEAVGFLRLSTGCTPDVPLEPNASLELSIEVHRYWANRLVGTVTAQNAVTQASVEARLAAV